MVVFTIGVYGITEDIFFKKLVDNKIDIFCDIRQRRGVRGSKYAFVNSKYLQNKLADIGIKYIYEKQLAPTREIREKQWAEDKAMNLTKKTRNVLGKAFISGYNCLLDNVNLNNLVKQLNSMNASNVVFFCLESNPEACHRSLLAKRLSDIYSFNVVNL